MEKMTEFDGGKVKNVPTVKSISYADIDEAKRNREDLEEILVDMIVYYVKNEDKHNI